MCGKEELHYICSPYGYKPRIGKPFTSCTETTIPSGRPYDRHIPLQRTEAAFFCSCIHVNLLFSCFSVWMCWANIQLAVEFLVGAAVFVRCFVDKRATEEQIISKLGNGFSTAPFATVVVILSALAVFYLVSQLDQYLPVVAHLVCVAVHESLVNLYVGALYIFVLTY